MTHAVLRIGGLGARIGGVLALAAMVACLGAVPTAAMVQARSLCGDDPQRVHYDGADLHFLGLLVLHNWYRPLAESPWQDAPIGAAMGLIVIAMNFVTSITVAIPLMILIGALAGLIVGLVVCAVLLLWRYRRVSQPRVALPL